MQNKSILFISNGFAEDFVGAALVRELKKLNSHYNFYALPVVGEGQPYRKLGVTVLGPCWELPSHGITYGEEFDLRSEIKAGAIQLYLGKIISLLKNRNKIDLVVGVGDYLSILVTGILLKKPLVYLWVTVTRFDKLAKYFLKKYGRMIFSRWRKWSGLREFKVEFVGNPNMDTFEITGDDFGADPRLKTIGIFPGSRQPAYNNLPILIEIIKLIQVHQKVNFIFGISPKIDQEKFVSLAKQCPGCPDNLIFTSKFGDVLNKSDLIIGLGGACNEQAAGMGKPVVTFWGGGHPREECWVLEHAQSFLTGAALVLPPKAELIADSILSLLADSVRMNKMGEAGIDGNGGFGGSKIIAERITEWFAKN